MSDEISRDVEEEEVTRDVNKGWRAGFTKISITPKPLVPVTRVHALNLARSEKEVPGCGLMPTVKMVPKLEGGI